MARLRRRFAVAVNEIGYFRLRRWVRARDPDAALKARPCGEEDNWQVDVETRKRYLSRRARRLWGG